MNKKLGSLDICKFFMAILIIAKHTHPLHGCTNQTVLKIWECIILVPVPFFFMAGTFLIFKNYVKGQDLKQYLPNMKKNMKKYLSLYLIWTVLYLPATFYDYANNVLSWKDNFFHFWRNLIFVGEHYYSLPLWYLLSSVYSLLLIYFLIKRNLSEKRIFMFSVIIFFFSAFYTYHIARIENPPMALSLLIKMSNVLFLSNDRLFAYFIYPVMGILIAVHKETATKRNAVLLMASGMVLFLFSNPYCIRIGQYMVSVGFFLFVLTIDIANSKLLHMLRKCSTSFYLMHMYFFFIYTLLFTKEVYFGMEAFLFVFGCCSVFACAVIAIRENM